MAFATLLALLNLGVFHTPAGALEHWEAFRSEFIAESGRILDSGNGHISHSEGQAYAMLAAVTVDKHADFERLWFWTETHLQVREDRLLAWRWNPETGAVDDANNATDGDVIAAWALLRAEARWPSRGYGEDARVLLADIQRLLVVETEFGPVLLPGLDGFRSEGTLVLNLSYWVFPALDAFAAADPAGPWLALAQTGQTLIGTARFGAGRLPPDWLSLDDDALQPDPARPARFGYDALRIPLYLCWGGRDSPALEAIQEAWQAPDPPAWIDLESGEPADWSLGAGGHAVRQLLRLCTAATTACAEANAGGALLIPASAKPAGETTYYDAILTLLTHIALAERRPCTS